MKNKSKSKSAVPKVDPYIDGLMAKLLERLVSLENKMDKVISQTAGAVSGNGQAPKHPQNSQPQAPPRRDRVLYEAICADCHKVCEVPFKPSEDRAVYCKECFARRKFGPQNKTGTPVLTPAPIQKPGVESKKTKKRALSKKTKKK